MDMKNMCVKVDVELYEQVRENAKSMRMSLSDFMRDVLMKSTCNPNGENKQNDLPSHEHLHEENMRLHDMLERKETRNENLENELTESSKRHDTIVMQLTQQLDRVHLQLEDMRHRKTVWQRIRSVFVAES